MESFLFLLTNHKLYIHWRLIWNIGCAIYHASSGTLCPSSCDRRTYPITRMTNLSTEPRKHKKNVLRKNALSRSYVFLLQFPGYTRTTHRYASQSALIPHIYIFVRRTFDIIFFISLFAFDQWMNYIKGAATAAQHWKTVPTIRRMISNERYALISLFPSSFSLSLAITLRTLKTT